MWFIIAATKAVYANYKYGDPEYDVVNRFIFAYFVARVIFFFAVFGSLYSDLALFTGLVGLSVSMNGGVARPAAQEQPRFAFGRMGLGSPSPDAQQI